MHEREKGAVDVRSVDKGALHSLEVTHRPLENEGRCLWCGVVVLMVVALVLAAQASGLPHPPFPRFSCRFSFFDASLSMFFGGLCFRTALAWRVVWKVVFF